MQSEADDREPQALIVLPGGIGGCTSCAAKQLRIDPEFQSLIPPLSKDEKAALQASILEEGCRDPLVVWAEEKLLIDGHNRFAICTAHGIPYKIVEMSFDSRNAVKVWTIANQLGRRSLTPESVSYLRGTWYELTKESHGGKRSANCHFDSLTDKISPDRASCQNGSLTDKTMPDEASCQNDHLTDKTMPEGASCQNGSLTDMRSTRVRRTVQSFPQNDLPGCPIYESCGCSQFYWRGRSEVENTESLCWADQEAGHRFGKRHSQQSGSGCQNFTGARQKSKT